MQLFHPQSVRSRSGVFIPRFLQTIALLLAFQAIAWAQDAASIRNLWDQPTPATVEKLDKYLSDPNPDIRKAAIQALRHFASRVTRKGALPAGPVQMHAPILPDIAPYLLKASHDNETSVRQLALFALADSRDPAAVIRLKQAMNDPDPRTALLAAALLAEFDDPAALGKLKESIIEISKSRFDVSRFTDAAQVIAGLERLTGQSLGSIPMAPGLSSGSQVEKIRLEVTFNELINKWAEWATKNPTTAPADTQTAH